MMMYRRIGLLCQMLPLSVLLLLLAAYSPAGAGAAPTLIDRVREAGLGMESFLQNFSCTNLLAPLPGGERCPRPGFDAALEPLTVEKVLDLGKAVDSYTQHASGVLGPLWAAADVLTATLRGFAGDSKTGGDNQTSGLATCSTWPPANISADTTTVWALPVGAREAWQRDTGEACAFWSAARRFMESAGPFFALPALLEVSYATPEGEYLSTSTTQGAVPLLTAGVGYDAREEEWFRAAAAARRDLVVVVELSASSRADAMAAAQALTAIDGVLALLSEQDRVQIVISGTPGGACLGAHALVPASPSNRAAVRAVAAEALAADLLVGAQGGSVASLRAAWTLLRDATPGNATAAGGAHSEAAAPCARTVVVVTDGVIPESAAEQALALVDAQQRTGTYAQVHAVSVGDGACAFCVQLACNNQGVHLPLAGPPDPAALRSRLQIINQAAAHLLDAQTRERPATELQTPAPEFSAAHGRHVLTLAAPVLLSHTVGSGGSSASAQGRQLILHGVARAVFDLEAIWTELAQWDATERNDTGTLSAHAALAMRNTQPGLLLAHPLVQPPADLPDSAGGTRGGFARAFAWEAEGEGGSGWTTANTTTPLPQVPATHTESLFSRVLKGERSCALGVLDRRGATRAGSSTAARLVHEGIFQGAAEPSRVALCSAPVPGTSLAGYILVWDVPAPAAEPSEPADTLVFRLRTPRWPLPPDLAPPLLYAPAIAPGTAGSEGLSSTFALQLPPGAFEDPARYLVEAPASRAGADAALQAWAASDFSASELETALASSGAQALAGGGPTFRARRDAALVRRLAARWDSARLTAGAAARTGATSLAVALAASGACAGWPAAPPALPTLDVRAQEWFARALRRPDEVTVSPPAACAALGPTGGCLSHSGPQVMIARALATPAPVPDAEGGEMAGPPAVVGAVGAGIGLRALAAMVETSAGELCSGEAGTGDVETAECFLLDRAGALVFHPGMDPDTPLTTAPAEASTLPAGRSALWPPPSAASVPPGLRPAEASLAIWESHPALAQALLHAGVLVQRATGTVPASTPGVFYEVELEAVGAAGGALEVSLPRNELDVGDGRLAITHLRGSNLILLAYIRTGAVAVAPAMLPPLTGPVPLSSFCGLLSPSCPDLAQPHPAIFSTPALACGPGTTTSPYFSVHHPHPSTPSGYCPAAADAPLALLLGNTTDSAIGATLLRLRNNGVNSPHGVTSQCPAPLWIALAIGGGAGALALVLLIALCCAFRVREARRQKVQSGLQRDALRQDVQELDACVELLAAERAGLVQAARRFSDLRQLVHVEELMVELSVRRNRGRLRQQAMEVQVVRDLSRLLNAEMHAIHLRVSRLEASSADFEAIQAHVPERSTHLEQVQRKLEHLLTRDAEDSYLLTNAEEFYSAHHPDIFGNLSHLPAPPPPAAPDADGVASRAGSKADPSSPRPRAGVTPRGERPVQRPTVAEHLARQQLRPVEVPVKSAQGGPRRSPRGGERVPASNKLGLSRGASDPQAGPWANGAQPSGSVRPGEVRTGLKSPRLPKPAVLPTEQRAQHYMHLNAQRQRARLEGLAGRADKASRLQARDESGYSSLSFPEETQSEIGDYYRSSDLSDVQASHEAPPVRGILRGMAAPSDGAIPRGWLAVIGGAAPTASERGRILQGIDAATELDTHTLADDTLADVLTHTDMLTHTQLDDDTTLAEIQRRTRVPRPLQEEEPPVTEAADESAAAGAQRWSDRRSGEARAKLWGGG